MAVRLVEGTLDAVPAAAVEEARGKPAAREPEEGAPALGLAVAAAAAAAAAGGLLRPSRTKTRVGEGHCWPLLQGPAPAPVVPLALRVPRILSAGAEKEIG